jgi:glutaryl-CoA dehydrogenase
MLSDAISPKAAKAAFRWDDPFLLEDQLTADERAIRDAAQAFCQERLASRVLEQFRHETVDAGIACRHLLSEQSERLWL